MSPEGFVSYFHSSYYHPHPTSSHPNLAPKIKMQLSLLSHAFPLAKGIVFLLFFSGVGSDTANLIAHLGIANEPIFMPCLVFLY